MAKINIQEKAGSVTFEVRVIPRASKTEIVGEHNGTLKVKLKSPPVEGAANEELIKILSKEFGISKSDIDIVSGQTSKTKLVRVSGCDSTKIRTILKAKS